MATLPKGSEGLRDSQLANDSRASLNFCWYSRSNPALNSGIVVNAGEGEGGLTLGPASVAASATGSPIRPSGELMVDSGTEGASCAKVTSGLGNSAKTRRYATRNIWFCVSFRRNCQNA